MHFGARIKSTDRKLMFFDKITNLLLKDANVSRELKVAVDHLAHSDNDEARVKSMLDGIMRRFDFKGGPAPRFPLYVVRNVATLLSHTRRTLTWSLPIMHFLLHWLKRLSKSRLEGDILHSSKERGMELAMTVAEVIEALEDLVYNTDDEDVVAAFLEAKGPARINRRIDIAKVMYRSEYGREIEERISRVDRATAMRLLEARFRSPSAERN
jgi:hypothetical protein